MPVASESSEPGNKPLVDDANLGWDTNVNREVVVGAGTHTRLPSDGAHDYKVRSNRGWLILAVVIILGVAAAVTTMALAQ
jgi:hypothetical protein